MNSDILDKFHFIRRSLVTAAFVFVMLLFTPVSHAGGLGFALLALIAGITGFCSYFRVPDIKQIPDVIWALLGFLLWAVFTTTWTPYEDPHAFSNPAVLAIVALASLGILLLPPRHWLWALILLISAVLMGLLAFDIHSDYALSKYFFPLDKDLPEANFKTQEIARSNSIYQNLGHSITVLALLAPLVLVLLTRHFKAGLAFAVIWSALFCYLTAKFNLAVGLIAFGAALSFMGLAYKFGRRALDILLGLSIVSILFAPIIGYFMKFVSAESKANMPDSWEHRVEMWAYVAEKIAEKPIFGHGFDASRTFDKTYTGMSINGQPWEQTIVSLHPHNAGLHIWAETGAIGAALACLVLFLLRQAVEPVIRGNRGTTIALVGFLAAALMLCTFTYGIWQEWFWGALILIGALIPMSILNAK